VSYQINEVFFSLQGEGVRAGTPNVFVRFSGCNLTCTRDGEAGFDCDTEFVSGRKFSVADLLQWIRDEGGECRNVILTGGEPMLQVDEPLILALHAAGFYIAAETNGTQEVPLGIDWLCVSPKSAEHTLRVKAASELKYVRHYGMGIPRPSIPSAHYLISPAFRTREIEGERTIFEIEPRSLEWCIKLVKENPPWRLSVQQHKAWGVR
jgi:organic radical activating enzyme